MNINEGALMRYHLKLTDEQLSELGVRLKWYLLSWHEVVVPGATLHIQRS